MAYHIECPDKDSEAAKQCFREFARPNEVVS